MNPHVAYENISSVFNHPWKTQAGEIFGWNEICTLDVLNNKTTRSWVPGDFAFRWPCDLKRQTFPIRPHHLMLEIYKFNEGFCRRNLRLIAIEEIDDFFEIIDRSASCACA